jgi:hypothetical protein
MAYIINKYNTTQLAVVDDGTINTTLDIKLIGKNTAGYGEAQNENFVWLLENFARAGAPSNAITGQLWYNTETQKMRVNYGTGVWHTLGINDVVSTINQVQGLTQGDLFWVTDQQQLWCKGATENVLIGGKLNNISTQMKQSSVFSNTTPPVQYNIIEAVINGVTTFVISSAAVAFTLATNEPLKVAGWSDINPGITVKGYESTNKTSTDYKFYGSATNSDRLGSVIAANYVTKSGAEFSDIARFSNSGFAIGPAQNQILYITNDSDSVPTIKNAASSTIQFVTKVSGNLVYPVKFVGKDIMPGTTNIDGSNPTTWSNIGSGSYKFNEMYANSFKGTASNASAMLLSSVSYLLSETATAQTVAARTASPTDLGAGYTLPAGSIIATHVKADAFTGNASSSTGLLFDAVVRVPAVNILSGSTVVGGTVVLRSYSGENVTWDGASHTIPIGSIKANQIWAADGFYGNATSASKVMVGAAAYPAVAYTTTLTDLDGAIVARTSTNTSIQIGGSTYSLPAGSIQAKVMIAAASLATYADLAEKYISDTTYETGTVVMVGGEMEITAAIAGNRALGVISENPAYLMNVGLAGGIPVALKGRVPVNVIGTVKKGDRLIASNEIGFAQALSNSVDAEFVFAIALSDNDNNTVEAVIL